VFSKIQFALEGRRFQDTEDKKKCDEVTVSYYTTEVQKMFPKLLRGSISKMALLNKL
jgi:hypothetical protein